MNGKYLIIALFITILNTKAQTKLTIKEVISIFQSDPRFEDGGADWLQFEEQLLQLEQSKISLNSSSALELQSVPFFDAFMIYNLIRYRNQSGFLLHFYELQQVKGFSRQIIEILPFFTNLERQSNRLNPTQIFSRGKHTFAFRYQHISQNPLGFNQSNNGFQGNNQAWYGRYRLNYYNKFFMGFTLQKDAGERYPSQFPYISDYSSFHFELRFNKKITKIILGDYLANYGQGLALWSGMAYGKMATATENQRFGKGMAHYSGADENRFFRGLGIQLNWKSIYTDLFISRNLVDVTLNKQGLATSLVNSGLHRTPLEISKKNNQSVNTIGMHSTYYGTNINLGITAYSYSFGIPFVAGNAPYQRHNFQGNNNQVLSIDYNWIIRKSILFGEAAYSFQKNKPALIAGIKVAPVDVLQFSALIRSIPSGFHTLYNAPFSETGNSGEKGIYLAAELKPHSKWTINAYADRFAFDWLKFSNPSINSGEEYLIEAKYRVSHSLVTYLRYKTEIGIHNLVTDHLYETDNYNLQALRWNLKYKTSDFLIWSSRLEYRKFKQQSGGFLMYQDLSIKFPKSPIHLDLRISVFHSSSFNTAIYALEDDLPYSYNLALFHNEGLKHYFLFKYHYKKVEFWFRLAHLWYPRKLNLGTGNDQIPGNEKTTLKWMIRLKL